MTVREPGEVAVDWPKILRDLAPLDVETSSDVPAPANVPIGIFMNRLQAMLRTSTITKDFTWSIKRLSDTAAVVYKTGRLNAVVKPPPPEKPPISSWPTKKNEDEPADTAMAFKPRITIEKHPTAHDPIDLWCWNLPNGKKSYKGAVGMVRLDVGGYVKHLERFGLSIPVADVEAPADPMEGQEVKPEPPKRKPPIKHETDWKPVVIELAKLKDGQHLDLPLDAKIAPAVFEGRVRSLIYARDELRNWTWTVRQYPVGSKTTAIRVTRIVERGTTPTPRQIVETTERALEPSKAVVPAPAQNGAVIREVSYDISKIGEAVPTNVDKTPAVIDRTQPALSFPAEVGSLLTPWDPSTFIHDYPPIHAKDAIETMMKLWNPEHTLNDRVWEEEFEHVGVLSESIYFHTKAKAIVDKALKKWMEPWASSIEYFDREHGAFKALWIAMHTMVVEVLETQQRRVTAAAEKAGRK